MDDAEGRVIPAGEGTPGVRWHRCIRHALTGGLLGLAYSAWAQEPGVGATDQGLLVELVRVGGLPGVIAWVAWTASRAWAAWVPTVRVVVISGGRDAPDGAARGAGR